MRGGIITQVTTVRLYCFNGYLISSVNYQRVYRSPVTRSGVVTGSVVGRHRRRTALHALRRLAAVHVTARRRVGTGALCRTHRDTADGGEL